jgi:hypothetical protein
MTRSDNFVSPQIQRLEFFPDALLITGLIQRQLQRLFINAQGKARTFPQQVFAQITQRNGFRSCWLRQHNRCRLGFHLLPVALPRSFHTEDAVLNQADT